MLSDAAAESKTTSITLNPVETFARMTPKFQTVDLPESGSVGYAPIDAEAYWQGEQKEGREHAGITQMALDIFGCPGLSFSS